MNSEEWQSYLSAVIGEAAFEPLCPATDAQISVHITELAPERRRFGSRHLTQFQRREGF